jgi:intramembrane prenyl-peptidase
MAHLRPLTIIFTTPLFFGLAHIHHAYEHRLHFIRSPGLSVLVTFVQFTYTTIFGWYASYLLLVTQTIWAPVLAHAFCNCMGLPRFWGGIPGVSRWLSAVYYVCLIAGAVGFYLCIGKIKPDGIVL